MKKRTVYAAIFSLILLFSLFSVVAIPAFDLNGDGSITISDLSSLAQLYRGKGTYNASYDFDNDADIDLFDLVSVAKNISSLSSNDSNTSEPFYDSGIHTLVYEDDMEKYAGMTITQLGDPSDPGWDPNFVGFRPAPAPYQSVTYTLNPAGFEILSPGRGGTGNALRLYRTGESQVNSYSWWSDNLPIPPNGAHHYFQQWVRVQTAQPLTQSLNVKWFMARHDGGASRFEWVTYWPQAIQHDTLPPTGTTVWMGIEKGTFAAQQAVPPYFNDIATPTGTWHRLTYEYKPNSAVGARDGIARMWVDGVKVIDISNETIGVTPPNGTKVWSTAADVDAIAVNERVDSITWPSVQTTGSPSWIMDVDDFVWWTE